MNYVWASLIILSLVFSVFTGSMSALSQGILDGANNAVNTCLKLLGTMALWNGLAQIASDSGLDKKAGRLLSPLLKRIFPSHWDTPAGGAISANVVANLLGLGNAATPLGIEAMRRMSHGNEPDNETVRFVVINTASLTLIPTTVAALRSAAGSKAPFSILIPVWLTGITALIFGLAAEKILSKRWK